MFQFQGFTEKANNALNLAVQSAEQCGHSYIGTEHVLLGLLKEGTGVAYHALTNCGVTAEQIEEKVSAGSYVGAPTDLTPNDFTPRTKRVLRSAVSLSARVGSSYVGTEHLLIALVSDTDCYAVSFLNEAGVSVSELVKQIQNLDRPCYRQGKGDRARYPDPFPPHQEQPCAHRRAGCRQNSRSRGLGA